MRAQIVVYLLIPTSNHNVIALDGLTLDVVYLLIPTSNHNDVTNATQQGDVVYLLIPTSNHNLAIDVHTFFARCLSLDSYIKPQRMGG